MDEPQSNENAPKRRKLEHLVKASHTCTVLKSIARTLYDETEKIPTSSSVRPVKTASTSTPSSNSSATETTISPSLLIQSATCFSLLKRWNRIAQLSGVSAKTTTNEERDAVDRVRLELQNLRYEASHLEREIEKCESFQSVYQDVVLVPEEEFLAKAPKELLEAENLHMHMINQLKYEMQERVRLEQEKGNQLSLSMKLTKENRERKADIENIERELETLYQNVILMQTKLRMQPTPAPPSNKGTPSPPISSSAVVVENRNTIQASTTSSDLTTSDTFVTNGSDITMADKDKPSSTSNITKPPNSNS